MKELSEAKVLHKLARYCSLAERCVDDIRKKMTHWEIAPPIQLQIIKKLQAEHFLDEERYCQAFVHDKSKFNKWGYNKIKFELSKKNIPGTLILTALKNLDTQESRKILTELLKKKKKSVKGKSAYEIQQKLIRFAAGKGFPIDDILQCMEQL